MSLSENATLTQREVERRIDELAESGDTEFEVYRVKNDDVIRTFDDEDDANEFIDTEDYDTSRVSVRSSGGLDDDDQQELNDLREFDAECGRDVPNWNYGTVVYNEHETDSDTVKEIIKNKYGRPGVDFDEFPFNLIDFSEASDEIFSDAGSNYGTLNGVSFYALGE